jgi:hypothetical protein
VLQVVVPEGGVFSGCFGFLGVAWLLGVHIFGADACNGDVAMAFEVFIVKCETFSE